VTRLEGLGKLFGPLATRSAARTLLRDHRRLKARLAAG
jgi:hypothetical protein